MKKMSELLEGLKGPGKANDVVAGKKPFNKTVFSDLVHTALNDTSFTVPKYDSKTGEQIGTMSLSELIRDDVKKTLDNAGYPQKSEVGVIDKVEISTKGLEKVIPEIVMLSLTTGRQMPLPQLPDVNSSLYLKEVPEKTKKVNVRDPKTQKELGTRTITTKRHVQLSAKNNLPDRLKKKVNG